MSGDADMATPGQPPAQRAAQAMARAATAWLAELDDDQRGVAWWGPPTGDDEHERRLWFYTPTDHGGLLMRSQHDWQQRRAMQLVAAGLSSEGYALVSTIMGNENILDQIEGFTQSFDTSRGRDPTRYYLRVFGDPGGSGPWAWRFGGHHISLNFLVVDGEVRSSTPRFLGMDPAVSPLPGGATLDPLRGFEAIGRELVTSLSPDARRIAVLLDRAPGDIVMGNRSAVENGARMMKLHEIFRRRRGDADLIERMRVGGNARDAQTGYGPADYALTAITTAPKGIAGSDLDGRQKAILDRLMKTYADALPAGLARAQDLEQLHFAWAGSTAVGAPNYYRIQGDDVLIEWDNTARDANHAHGVIRHPSNDFGGDVLGSHRATWHQQTTSAHHTERRTS